MMREIRKALRELPGTVGEYSVGIAHRLETDHYICTVSEQADDDESFDYPFNLCFDRSTGVLSINLLRGDEILASDYGRVLHILNESVNVPRNGLSGKCAVRVSREKPAYLDVCYSWEIALAPALLKVTDLSTLVRTQMTAMCNESIWVFERVLDELTEPVN